MVTMALRSLVTWSHASHFHVGEHQTDRLGRYRYVARYQNLASFLTHYLYVQKSGRSSMSLRFFFYPVQITQKIVRYVTKP